MQGCVRHCLVVLCISTTLHVLRGRRRISRALASENVLQCWRTSKTGRSQSTKACLVSSVLLHIPHSLHASPAHTADASFEASFIACDGQQTSRSRCDSSFMSTRQHKAQPICLPTLFSVAACHKLLVQSPPTLLLKQPACYKLTF